MSGYNEKIAEATAILPSPTETMVVFTKARRTRTKPSVHRRRKLKCDVLFIQLLVSLLIVSLLSSPVVWSLATTTKNTNNLSQLESFLLRSRLERIKNGIQKDYSSQILLETTTAGKSNSETKTTDNNMPTPSTSTTTSTFIFPGAGGVDDLILELQASIPNSVVIDWKEYRGSMLTASYDSEVVGEAVAEIILRNQKGDDEKENKIPISSSSLSSGIQFIGISVGAFAANAAATIVYQQITEKRQQQSSKKDNDDRDSDDLLLDVNLVLLDPFCGRGVLGTNYGRDNFGKYSTTALQILNTDDPVPFTNESLPYCYCIDVTDASEKQDFVLLPGDSMHSWPLAYFVRHYCDNPTTGTAPAALFPRGTVEKVS